jgi:tRNA nucleotidyltransferase (CCA-adding enzyme)
VFKSFIPKQASGLFTMDVYLVGGAVRDNLLGLKNSDRDWVVVGATAAEMLASGFLQVGRDFPVFLHPQSKEEYALARTERKSGHGHTGFKVIADPSVTLEEDLLRRDLTINAIAQDTEGRLIDPYNGCRDLQQKILRHVSPAFSEDPLRVLRVARFAARFADRGFSIADETMQLMSDMVLSGELQHLPAERIWQELEKSLREPSPVVFVQTLRKCGALQIILPEVDRLFGIPQPEQYHPEIDTGEHILMALDQACSLSKDPVVRYATLLHDVGKGITPENDWPHHYRHEHLGVALVEDIGKRLRVPKEYTAIAKLVCHHHLRCHQLQKARPITILRLLEALDAFRRPQQMEQFLLSCEADARGRTGFEQHDYPQADLLRKAFAAAKQIDITGLLQAHKLLPGSDQSPHDAGDATARKALDLKIRELVARHRTAAVKLTLES